MSQPVYFSDVFQVPRETIESYGALDLSLVADLPLFIDPFLLFHSQKPEYRRLHDEIIGYVRFLRSLSLEGGIRPGTLGHLFRFPEVKQNWLGYSRSGNRGSGLGPHFAEALNRNLGTIFRDFGGEQVTRGSHLEKLCLIRDGVGRDNISDFTTNLIKGFLLEFTERFAKEHLDPRYLARRNVPKVRFNQDTRVWESGVFTLPVHRGDYVLLTPRDMLTREETWINRDDLVSRVEDLASGLPNAELRAALSDYLLRNLAVDASKEDRKRVVSEVIERFPQVLDYYIREREEEGDGAHRLSERRVEEVRSLFIEHASSLIAILSGSSFSGMPQTTLEEARARALFLKTVVEDRDGYRFFYQDGKPIQRESDLQTLFVLTWFGSSCDVNREVNNGRGPVDFKISRGSLDMSLVEFKLASNTKLRRNLERQVGVYEKANQTRQSVKVIMYFSDSEESRVRGILAELKMTGDPNVVLIDARSDNKPSGSNA
jgi:hypothetical protein